MSPLIGDFFLQLIQSTVLHDQRSVESAHVEMWFWRANCEVIHTFSIAQRVGIPNTDIVRGSTVYHHHFLYLIANKKVFMAT